MLTSVWTLATLCVAQGELWLPEEPAEPEPFVAVSGLRPESVVLFTGEELLRRGYQTLGEALADVIGVDVQRSSRRVHYGMRGVPDGLLLVVDGVPQIVDGERDLLDVDSGLDLADIDRIEVVRGPASAVNGAGSSAGVVRVFSRSPGLTGGRLRIGASHLGQIDLSGDVTVRRDDTAVRITGLHRRGSGSHWRLQGTPYRYIRIGDATLPSTKVNMDLEPWAESSIARLVLTHGTFGADASFTHSDEHTPLSSFSHAVLDTGPEQRRFRERSRLRCWGNWELGSARLTAMAWGGRHVRVDRIMLFPPRGIYPFGGRVSVHGRVWSAGMHSRLDLPITRNHRVVIAAFGDVADRDAHSDATDPVDGSTTPRLVELDDFGGSATAAAEYQGDLGSGWHVTAGVAIKWRTSYALALVPRAAVVFVPTDALTLRLAYAEGSRAPDPFDMVALSQAVVDGRTVGARANDDLAPEHARTGEIGLTLRPGAHLRVTLDGFITRHEAAVAQQTDELVLVPTNLDPRLIAGGETWAELDVSDFLRLHGGAALAKKLDGPPLDTNLAQAIAGATVEPISGLEVGARGRMLWRGERRVGSGLHPFVDAFVSYRRDLFEIRAALHNALDARDPRLDVAAGPSAAAVAIPAPGRSLFVQVEARL